MFIIKLKGMIMESIGSEEVGNALLIMSVMLVISITIVGLAMWGVYKFFNHKKNQSDAQTSATSAKAEEDKAAP